MNTELGAIVELLGEQNVNVLKSEIKDIIIDRIREDLEQCNEYILIPGNLQRVVDEIIEECKQEIKPMIREKLFEKALSQINI